MVKHGTLTSTVVSFILRSCTHGCFFKTKHFTQSTLHGSISSKSESFFFFFFMGLMSVCSFFAVCSFYVAVDLRRPPSFFLHQRSSNKNQRRKDRCLIMDFEDLSVNDDVPL